jgi:hypothetical protein
MSGLAQNHGTARRVPDPADATAWGGFRVWAGAAEVDNSGRVQIGNLLPKVGDWVIRTIDGTLHLARPDGDS